MPNATQSPTPAACALTCAEYAESADRMALMFRDGSRKHAKHEQDAARLREGARLLTTYADVIESVQACEADRDAAVATLDRAREAMTHGRA